MRSDATFIAVEVSDEVIADQALAKKLAEVCPVDIFRNSGADGPGLELVGKNVDECVLCRLCLDAAPQGTVRVLKLYDDEALLV